jgi:hypothetical protein
MAQNIFQNDTKTLPKRDSQIVRVDFEKQDISGRNVPKPTPSPELSISHVPNGGSKS